MENKGLRLKCVIGDGDNFIEGKIYNVKKSHISTSGRIQGERCGWYIRYNQLHKVVPLEARFVEQKIKSRKERLRIKKLRGV